MGTYKEVPLMSMKYGKKKQKETMDRISVIIPAFNAACYLGEAIESVLAQTMPADEIIVVDDGSDDDTAGMAEKFSRIHIIRQPNQGCAVARNTGIAASTGSRLAFLDADDIWLPEKLAIQSDYLKQHPSCLAVFGMAENFFSPELDSEQRSRLYCPSGRMSGIIAGAMLIRRDTFFQVGEFNPSMRLSQFIEWFTRFSEAGMEYHVLPDLVMRRRVHLNNTTAVRREDVHANYLKIARSRILRSKK
jgi:glycosyltransferase involved in cell wall biosynthesis